MGRLKLERGLKIKNKDFISTIFKSYNTNRIFNKNKNRSKSKKHHAKISHTNKILQRQQHALIQNNWSKLYQNYVFTRRKRTKQKQIKHKMDDTDKIITRKKYRRNYNKFFIVKNYGKINNLIKNKQYKRSERILKKHRRFINRLKLEKSTMITQNKMAKHIRQSRLRFKNKKEIKMYRKRSKPPMNYTRITMKNNKIIKNTKKETIKTISEGEKDIDKDELRQFTVTHVAEGQWIHKFRSSHVHKQGISPIWVDKKSTFACIDTGATRLLATSEWASKHYGKNYKLMLQKSPHLQTNDAQGKSINIIGYINATIQLGTFLTVKYPLLIYEAPIIELLMGYTFLYDLNLSVIPGKGITMLPHIEYANRINLEYAPISLFTQEDILVPPGAVHIVSATLDKKQLDEDNLRKLIGISMLTSSECLQPKMNIRELDAPFIYDIVQPDLTIRVCLDNSNSIYPRKYDKGEIIAHAEFIDTNESVPDKIQKIIADVLTFEKNPKDYEDIEIATQHNEFIPPDQSTPKYERYDYINKVNIKTKNKHLEKWARNLLYNTELFWSKHDFDHGTFDREANIELIDSIPVRDRYRPLNPVKQKAAKLVLNQLEKNDVINRQNSPYVAQACFVWKKQSDKGGKFAVAGEMDMYAAKQLRLAIDFRRLNAKIISNCNFPIPSIKALLNKLQNCHYVSIIDLTNSFFQIPLTEQAQKICSFAADDKQYIFKRLPHGLSLSSSILHNN